MLKLNFTHSVLTVQNSEALHIVENNPSKRNSQKYKESKTDDNNDNFFETNLRLLKDNKIFIKIYNFSPNKP